MSPFERRPCRSTVVTRAAVAEVESLEGRQMLALTLGVDGAGRLHSVTAADFAQTADVTLTVQPGNRLHVTEGATDYGTFKVAPNLSISLGQTTGGFVNRFDLNDQTLRANVRVELGDTQGLNQFRLTTAAGGEGTLDGNYTVRGGDTGSEFLVFGDFGQAAPKTINVTGSVKVDAGGGGQDPNSGPPDAVATVGTGPNTSFLNVGKNMHVTGSTVMALAGSVGGNLTSDSSDKATGQLVILGNFSQPLTVGGNVRVLTGDENDEVDLQGVLIKGNLNVDTAGGDDQVNIINDEDVTNSVPTRVRGNIKFDTGAGDDSVLVKALVAPCSRARFELGAGGDSFAFGDNADVDLESLLVDGGSGADTYTPGAGNSFNFRIRIVNVP